MSDFRQRVFEALEAHGVELDGYDANVLAGVVMEALSKDRIVDRAEVVTNIVTGKHHVRLLSSNGDVILWSDQYENRAWATAVALDIGVPVTAITEHASG